MAEDLVSRLRAAAHAVETPDQLVPLIEEAARVLSSSAEALPSQTSGAEAQLRAFIDEQRAFVDRNDADLLMIQRAEFNRNIGRLNRIARALAKPASEPAVGGVHPDDLAVDRFAAAMKAKLAKKRAEGRGGWEDKDDCSNVFLTHLLREHVEKGDPIDVGNLAMMIHQRGERIG